MRRSLSAFDRSASPIQIAVSMSGTRPFVEGWYVLAIGAERGYGILGEAHETPEAAARAAFNT